MINICTYCNGVIESHSIIHLHEHLEKFRGFLRVSLGSCQVCLVLMEQHNQKNFVTCLILASLGSFAGMKKFCGKCKYESIVIPTNHLRCSGCGGVYTDNDITNDITNDIINYTINDTTNDTTQEPSSLMNWWLGDGKL